MSDWIESEDKRIPIARLVNVVATFRLKVRKALLLSNVTINLFRLGAMTLKSANKGGLPLKYNPRQFAATTFAAGARRVRLKEVVALIFSSGNVVLTGATTEEKARASAQLLTRVLSETMRISYHLTNFSIANLVCSMNVGFCVDINTMDDALGSKSTYTKTGPRKFPACRVRPAKQKNDAVYLIYPKGAVVFTGAKTRDRVNRNHEAAFRLCQKFKQRAEDAALPHAMVQSRSRRSRMEKAKRIVKSRIQSHSDTLDHRDAVVGAIEEAAKKYMTKKGILYKTALAALEKTAPKSALTKAAGSETRQMTYFVAPYKPFVF